MTRLANTGRVEGAAEVVSLAPAKFEINLGARITSLGMLNTHTHTKQMATESMASPLLRQRSLSGRLPRHTTELRTEGQEVEGTIRVVKGTVLSPQCKGPTLTICSSDKQ